MKWNEKLRKLRGEKTIEEVTEATNLNPNIYSEYEAGNRIPLPQVKEIICGYFKVNVSDIW